MAKSDRGFASMPKFRVKEIAAKGGRASGKARRKKKLQENKIYSKNDREITGYAAINKEEIKELARRSKGKAKESKSHQPHSNL